MLDLIGSAEDGTSQTGGVEFFATDLPCPVPPGNGGFLKILISVSTGTVFNITLDGTDFTALNDGTALTADVLYEFNIPVRDGQVYNFTCTTTSVTDIFSVFYFD